MFGVHPLSCIPALLAALALWQPGLPAHALTAMDETEMADVTGAGLAAVWEDFRFLAKPTSYFEQIGTAAAPGTTFQRGDLRWYGISMSGKGNAANSYSWTETGGNMTACAGGGIQQTGCPIGPTITRFAAHDNPYVLRVFDYAGDGSPASSVGNGIVTWTGDRDPVTSAQTVLEYLAPTVQDDYRFAFWGEIEVGKNGASNNGLLKSQTLISGSAAGSVTRFFQFTEPGYQTFAMQYLSRLQGDFRFSVNQAAGSASDTLGQPVVFDQREGLHFLNVDAFIPLGQLYYQALTLDVPRNPDNSYITDGNFILQLPLLPDNLAVYTRHYAYSVADSDTAGYVTARQALLGTLPSTSNYFNTHGYSRWGDWYPCAGVGCPNPPTTPPSERNSYNDTSDGFVFRKCAGCSNFNAYAYRITEVDVRAGNNTYTSSQRYANYSACTPGTSGSARFNCGYGGAYSAGSAVTTVSGQTDPMSYVLNTTPSTGVNLPMISTGAVNLGDGRIEGLNIQSFRFTSFGANY